MTTIYVNNTASLTSALQAAVGGDVIKLAPGTYSGLTFKIAPSFASEVTITSADPSNPAVLTDFSLRYAKNWSFSDLEFKALDNPSMIANDGSYWAFKFRDTDGMSFNNVKVHGSLDGDASNDVSGISFSASKNVSITNSEFQQLERGLAIAGTQNVKVNNNSFHDLRSDGADFVQVNKVEVKNNTFSDFDPVKGDHPDAIQFWTTGTTAPSTDIVISGNVITRGDGEYTQGIFLRDQVGTLPYERVTISDNLIIGTGYNGIRIQGAKDIAITNNELVSFKGDLTTFVLVQGGTNVTLDGNKAAQISYDTSTNVTMTGNTITSPVLDMGSSALKQYLAAHGDREGLLSDLQSNAFVMAKQAASALLIVQAGDQYLTGDSKANLMEGFGGNDTLDGRGGEDTLVGGTGDDVYIIPNGAAKIVELAGEGIDTVIAKGEHVLAANVENLVFSTDNDKGWRGWGNELDNRLTGNAGGNLLDGAAGNDTIDGGAGNDTLVGGEGDDRLIGGDGDDVFRFAPGGGKDVVVDYGFGPGKESLDFAAYVKAGITYSLADVGGVATFSFSNGDSVTLLGWHASDLAGGATKTGWVM
ncbi:MAG: hypothetical protein DI570_07705 [Phenylobacterium zucineum]|nr:MAG: hypothetical protein DI570_07705 [Phenylobacterium zucineum]